MEKELIKYIIVMTNNFDQYKKYIENGFSNSPLQENDTYYVIELIRRGKDNPNSSAVNYHFKNYYIRKVEDIDKYKDEIIQLCDMFNLRAYASVNFKSFKQVTLDTMVELSKRIANNNFNKPYNIFESCSSSYFHHSNKRWIIDIDGDYKIEKIKEILNTVKPYNTEKIIDVFQTKSGYHIITKPFDKQEFDMVFNGVFGLESETPDIKTNHLTLIYENI